MPGRGEMADVIIGELGRRQPETLVAGGAVERGCCAQLDAFPPDRVVIVLAVEAEDAHRKARGVGVVGRGCRHLQAMLPNMRTFELNCLVTNSGLAMASSGVCIGMIAAGVSRSLRPLK